MNYSKKEFFALMERVEEQGGDHPDLICESRTYEEFVGPRKVKPLTYPMCGNPSIFEVPYEGHKLDRSGDQLEMVPMEGTITVCAVDDDMGRWPRFGGDRFAAPEFYIEPKEDD